MRCSDVNCNTYQESRFGRASRDWLYTIFRKFAALAHLGERQTEVHFESRIQCDFWRYCVRSTEAASLLLVDTIVC
jgi:hypothetical protein